MILKDIFNEIIPKIWPLILFITVVLVSIRLTYLLKGSKKVVIYEEIISLLFVIYILCLYHVLTNQTGGYAGVNFTPFKEMFRYTIGSYKFMKNIVGNILLFIPFGFFVSHYLNTKKAITPFIITLVVSSTAEAIQYRIGRVFDIDDIILNVFGGFLGYLIFICLTAIRSKLPRFMKSDTFLNILVIIILVLIVLFSLGINIFSYL